MVANEAAAHDDDWEGPEADTPMSLGEHLDELRTRMLRAVAYAAVACVACYFWRHELTWAAMYPARSVAQEVGFNFQVVAPTELFFTIMKLVIVSGLFFSGPLILFELWQFVATGLYPQEKTAAQMFAPFSYILFIAGCSFCFFVMQPVMLWFLLTFDVEQLQLVEVKPRFADIINLALSMSLIMGLIFQLPLVMLFLAKIRVVPSRVFRGYRRHFIMGAVCLAAVLTPTGDAVSLGLTMAPILLLFEIGVVLCRLVEHKRTKRAEEEEEA